MLNKQTRSVALLNFLLINLKKHPNQGHGSQQLPWLQQPQDSEA